MSLRNIVLYLSKFSNRRSEVIFSSCQKLLNRQIFSTMSCMKYAVSLVCPEGNHDPIVLPHRELVFIGRSPDTRIVDPRCSRKQLQLSADLNTGDVEVVQLGQNSSALDGIEMKQKKLYTMKPTSTLHVLTGCFPQKLDVKKLKNSDDKKQRHKSAYEEDTVIRETSKARSSSSGSTPKSHSNSKASSADSTSKSSHSNSSSSKSSNSSSSKPSMKRPSSSDINDNAPKKQKLSNGNSGKNDDDDNSKASSADSTSKSSHSNSSSSKSSNSSSSKPSKKRPSSSDINDNAPKKQKLSNGNSGKKDDDDSDHMKDVAAKLELLKSSAKKMKTPTKSSSSLQSELKVPESPSVQGSSPNGSVSQGPAPESRWDQYETLYVYTAKGLENRRKIAAFDIDGTIITTESGKKFPTHPGDWILMYYKEIPKKLKKLHEDGYKVVFITNQMGVSKGKTKIADLKSKFMDVLDKIGIPIQILVSTKGGLYRKPCPGMWNFLVEKLNGGVEVKLPQSFYVGDAAGRAKNWAPKKRKDFSCSDRLFALNIGIEFKTPEEYFVGYPSIRYTKPKFDPREISSKTQLFDPADTKLTSGSQEVILLAGFPASGKSFFAKKYLEPKGYVVVNRDTLKVWQKCVALCKDSLKKGMSVVVDNTNPDVESRARYIKAASACGVPCRCFVFTTSFEHARHNERFREITDKSHDAINEMIMNSFKKKYVLPEKKEGFSEVAEVNFVPMFKDPKLEELYRMFLLEK